MQASIKIHGAAEIRRAMQELPKRVDQKMLNEGLLAGARLVRDEAKQRVPLLKVPDPRRVRGAIRRAIVAGRVRPERYAATVLVRVRKLTKGQVARWKKKSGKAGAANPADPFYWWFVERGTSKMAAQPFMRGAFEGRKEQAVRTAMERFHRRVQEEIARLGMRGGR